MAITLKTSEIKVTQSDKTYPATLLEFEIEGGIAEPSELADLEPPNVLGDKGIVISGRGPVWLYAYLTHHYHVTKFVGTFDPRLGGVIVSTHARDVPPIGSVVAIPKFA